MTITIEDMADKLVPIADVVRILGRTEPLGSEEINESTRIRFRMEPGWETQLDALSGEDTASAWVTINGTEREMTKDGALAATSLIGLPRALVKRTPSSLVESFLNHFWNDLGDKAHNALFVDEKVAAFTKPQITPFSNLELIQRAIDAIEERWPGTPVFADYKFEHGLAGTNVRLIVPEIRRDMEGTALGDQPVNEADRWFGGIHLQNHLTGKGSTSFEPYLFRWWCTNGATTERKAGMSWARKGVDGQNQDDLYAWAARAVDEVLNGLEVEFEKVQSLASLSVTGNLTEVLTEVYTQYGVPVHQRNSIQEYLTTSEGPLTMYSIMNAVTQVANAPGADATLQDRMMRIGGAIPSVTVDPLKARVWREGHLAEDDRNPYEITSISL